MDLQQKSIPLLLMLATIGCGRPSSISENRKNFPPWEKLPEGQGIAYVGKFTHDPGIDPVYLAKMEYEDDVALQLVIDTFGLVARVDLENPSSFASSAKDTPPWFPLERVTHLYVFPPGPHEYLANLWVNADERTMILERSWW